MATIDISVNDLEIYCPFKHEGFRCISPDWWPYCRYGKVELGEAVEAIARQLGELEQPK